MVILTIVLAALLLIAVEFRCDAGCVVEISGAGSSA